VLTERYRERLAWVLSCYDRIIVTGTLPGACHAKGRLAPDCRHALAGRAAWLAVGCLVPRWVSGRGRPGRRLHEIGHGRRFRSSSITNCRSAGFGRFSCREGERGRIDRVLPCQVPAGRALDRRRFSVSESRSAPTTGNRDYRWSSTPDADRCAVFGIGLGQRPSEPRDLADRLRPAAILQLPDTRRA
jgi:hypothetical protein